MQNSEAVQAWFQGKMASFRILGLVSKNEIRSREFSFSSRYMRVKIINLDLVSMPEIGGNFFSVSSRSLRVSVRNSRSRLDERDWIGETLILVSTLKKRLSLTTALYTEKWHWLAKYCGVGKYYNLVRVVASLFYPALALGLQAAHSLRITKWEMLLLYNKQIQLWSTRSNMFLVWNLLLPAICDKRQTSP